jgi:aryl-alcohol dehydrogenase-like predicted oxidoreductase
VEQVRENVRALEIAKRLGADELNKVDEVLGNSSDVPPQRLG